MSWSVRGPGPKEGSACGCGRPGVLARSLDQAGEAAGVAKIQLVLRVLPPWSLGFCKVGQKGRGGGGANCQLLGRWETIVPGGQPGPSCWGATGADFSIGAGWNPAVGPKGPNQCVSGTVGGSGGTQARVPGAGCGAGSRGQSSLPCRAGRKLPQVCGHVCVCVGESGCPKLTFCWCSTFWAHLPPALGTTHLFSSSYSVPVPS